jgi:hypothetical protein
MLDQGGEGVVMTPGQDPGGGGPVLSGVDEAGGHDHLGRGTRYGSRSGDQAEGVPASAFFRIANS